MGHQGETLAQWLEAPRRLFPMRYGRGVMLRLAFVLFAVYLLVWVSVMGLVLSY